MSILLTIQKTSLSYDHESPAERWVLDDKGIM